MSMNDNEPQISEGCKILPYSAIKVHGTGTNNNTEMVILDIIRSAYPNHEITPVLGRECDFRRWAEAGHATLTMKRQGRQFVSRRQYHTPESRLRDGVGSLGEYVTFGEFDLDYRGTTFLLYTAEWDYTILAHKTRMFYLLSPASGLNTNGYSPAIDDLLLVTGKWTSELHDEVYVFASGDWTKNSSLYKAIQSSHWADILLSTVTKQNLKDDVLGFFNSKAMYREYAAPWKRGLIFHGPPGNGKTMTIKALANSLEQCPETIATLIVKSFDKCEGPQEGIRMIFSRARQMAPCLLVLEDLDSLLGDETRSYFLNEVDGIENNEGILIIASTNYLGRLDPAVTKRPSRFDRKYHFGLPSVRERVRYLEHWRTRLETNDWIDFDPAICEVVAKMTEGFSFAYLKELMLQTLLAMARAEFDKDAKNEFGGSASGAADGPNDADTRLATDSEVLSFPTTSNCEENDTLESLSPLNLRANLFMQVLRAGVATLKKDMGDNCDTAAET